MFFCKFLKDCRFSDAAASVNDDELEYALLIGLLDDCKLLCPTKHENTSVNIILISIILMIQIKFNQKLMQETSFLLHQFFVTGG